jgi:hypothetical protein
MLRGSDFGFGEKASEPLFMKERKPRRSFALTQETRDS